MPLLKKKILFFSPLAARNGAEMMLFHLVNNIDRGKFEVAVFFNQQGELVNDFKKIGIPVFVSPYRQSRYHFHYNRLRKKVFGISAYEKFIQKIHSEFKPDLWYVNTFKLNGIFPLAKKMGVTCVLHTHENHLHFQEIKKEELANICKADMVVACAEWVAEAYRNLGMQRVEVLYEMVDLSAIKASSTAAAKLRQKHHIPITSYVWLMSGNTAYRKGIDLIPDIIENVNRTNVFFVWMGPVPKDALWAYVQRQIQIKGIKNFIHVGAQNENYYEYMNMCDGFMLCARYDSFPLVMTEAAALGKPIAAFNSFGVNEFLKNDMGAIVNNHNPADLAKVMCDIMDKKVVCNTETIKARAKDFDAPVLTAKWQWMMENFLNTKHEA